MAQLTRQDVAEVVEEVVDRVLDRKLDEKLDQKLDEKFDEKLGLKPGETLDDKLGLKPGETLDDKLGARFAASEDKIDRKMGFFIEHIDDKFDGLAEAVSLMNDNINKKADKTDLEEIKQDIKTIKFAVKETNKDLMK
ncbi:MAG TPA: hypothetical protein VFH99_00800 [Candidatus Saccharimonadales bacterium]|nr:hypothetical protein [Candidatus Saccharimonadales bacterium]